MIGIAQPWFSVYRDLGISSKELYILLCLSAAVEKELAPKDAINVVEEILPALNQSYTLALLLNIPHYEVESIHRQHTDPHDRLLHVIMAFINRDHPKPTWRSIVHALRNEVIGLPNLARKLELAHVPSSLHAQATGEDIRINMTYTISPGTFDHNFEVPLCGHCAFTCERITSMSRRSSFTETYCKRVIYTAH